MHLRWFVVLYLFVMSSAHAVEIRQRQNKTPKNSRSNWSVVFSSLAVHGIAPGGMAVDEIPRKIDGGGTAVWTPGLGLLFDNRKWMVLLAGLKDCYDNYAGTLQVGRVFPVSQNTSWGYSMGLYVRQTPLSCTRELSSSSFPFGPQYYVDECTEIDSYPAKMNLLISGHQIDVIPLPFLHFSTSIIKSRSLQVDLKIMSNFVLNELGFAIPF